MPLCLFEFSLNTLALHEQPLASSIIRLAIDSLVDQEIGEAGEPIVEVREPERMRRYEPVTVFTGGGVFIPYHVPQVPHVPVVEAGPLDFGKRGAFERLAAPGHARAGVAAIIRVALVMLAGEGAPAAVGTMDHLAQQKTVCLGLRHCLAPQDGLHAVIEGFRDEGLVDTREGFAGRSEADDTHVEGVVEDDGEGVRIERFAGFGCETLGRHFAAQVVKSNRAGGIPLEKLPDQGASDGIDGLHGSLAVVPVSDGRAEGIEPLLQAPVHAFLHLLTEVPDVVGGDHGLNVGREAPTTGQEVEVIGDETHVDAAVDENSKVRPVLEVPGAAVDFVDDEPVGTAGL